MPPESVLADAGISLELAKNATFARGKGCSYCQKKGYRGRLAIFEIMLVHFQDSRPDLHGRDIHEIRKGAISQGMSTLYVDGIRKAMSGVTTLEEVYRVAKRTEQDVITA